LPSTLPGETQDYFGILTHLMKQFVISSVVRGLKTFSVTVSERSEHGGLKFEDVERPSSILHPKDEKDKDRIAIKDCAKTTTLSL